jgi:hypothetical protein
MAATRIAEARAHLKSKGRRVAGAVPFGYAADPHTKQLVVCEKDADIVVRMFKWAQDGVAPANIAALAMHRDGKLEPDSLGRLARFCRSSRTMSMQALWCRVLDSAKDAIPR